MEKQLSYLNNTIECLYSDLNWIDKLKDEYKNEKLTVEVAFTTLKKRAISKAGCCHLIPLIRVAGTQGYNGKDKIPGKRIEILGKLPGRFQRIGISELREYLIKLISENIKQIEKLFPPHIHIRVFTSTPKNYLIKKYVDYYIAKYPDLTKEEIFFRVAEKTGNSYENVKRLYYLKPKKGFE
jgi:hypothetical protein